MHDELEVDLRDVMVQPGSMYSIVLGCDQLVPNGDMLSEVKVLPGLGVKWTVAKSGTTYLTRAVRSTGRQQTTSGTRTGSASPSIPLPPPPPPPGVPLERQVVSLTTTVVPLAAKQILQKAADRR